MGVIPDVAPPELALSDGGNFGMAGGGKRNEGRGGVGESSEPGVAVQWRFADLGKSFSSGPFQGAPSLSRSSGGLPTLGDLSPPGPLKVRRPSRGRVGVY